MTPWRCLYVPEVLSVHEIPSEEVRMITSVRGKVNLLFELTVTKSPFPKVTPLRISDVPEVLSVQVVPSEEVRMIPN